VIQGIYTAAAAGTVTDATKETGFFWQHLRLAGFVSGTGTEQPFNAVSGRIGVQTSRHGAGQRHVRHGRAERWRRDADQVHRALAVHGKPAGQDRDLGGRADRRRRG